MAIFSKNNKDFIAPLYVGTNEQSEDIFIDFSRIRNLLLFGDMGAGKTNLMNNMVMSLIENFSPEQCKIALFDTKSVEFYQFEKIKHLYCKVSDHDEIIDSLKSIHMLIQERYRLLSSVKCMNITKYNSQTDNKLPYIVCFIDEIAELILNYPQEILELMENISHGFPVGVFLIAGTKEFMPEVFNAKLRFLFENFITFKTSKEKCSVDYMKIYLNDIKPYTIKKTGQHIIRLQLGDSKVLEGKFISDEIIEQKINLINQLLNKTSNHEVVEKMLSIIHSESSDLSNNDICTFIKDAKKITLKTIYIKESTQDDLIKSEILDGNIQESQRCIIMITSNKNATLLDLDTIMNTISLHHNGEYILRTIYDTQQIGFKIDILSIK